MSKQRDYRWGMWFLLGCIASEVWGCQARREGVDDQAVQPEEAAPQSTPKIPVRESRPGVEGPTEAARASHREVEASADATRGSADGASATGPCVRMCEHTVRLACGSGAACLEYCAEMLEVDLCPEAMEAFLACAVQRPDSDWECTPQRVAAVKDGVCDGEQRAFLVCVQREMVGTPPGN